jgi:hypothetical protein
MKTLTTHSPLALLTAGIGLALVLGVAPGRAAERESYTVRERGLHHRVIERVTAEPNPLGGVVYRTNQIIDLATGMHYVDSQGALRESEESIDLFPGGAAARKGPLKATFAQNLATKGSIQLELPDGKTLRSSVVGLSYQDLSTGKSVLLAEVKDCSGVVLPPSQVLYEDAFTDISASVRYTYSKAGFEQDILIHSQIPAPQEFGLSEASTVLQVLTEFYDSPAPAQSASRAELSDGTEQTDWDLDFGSAQLGRGKAFSFGKDALPGEAPVTKEWTKMDGRDILVEQVPVKALRSRLQGLPEGAALDPGRKAARLASARLPAPLRRTPASAAPAKPMEMAAAGSAPRGGLLLDYVFNLSSATNFTFAADNYTTYYASGTVNLYGTVTFEGGCVVKMAANASINILPGAVAPRVEFGGTAFRPVVFTAKDDNSCGEAVSGSSGSPSGYYGNPALSLPANAAQSLAHVRFAYARKGLSLSGTNLTLLNGQFLFCESALNFSGGSAKVLNSLFSGVKTNFLLQGNATVNAQNCTFSSVGWLANESLSNSSVALTNCILANVTNQSAGSVTLGGSYNAFFNATSFGANAISCASWPFQTVGGGDYYLADGSSLRDSGATNLDSSLALALKAQTTYPPIAYVNTTFTGETTFSPQAQRDTDVPDLGAHYPPLDYVFGGCTANTNITFTPGTVAGWFHYTSGWQHAGHGIHLADRAKLVWDGRADALAWWVRYNTVQEAVSATWRGGYGPGGITGWAATRAAAPEIQARFLRASVLSGDGGSGNHFRDDYGYLVVRTMDCEFYAGGMGGYESAHYHTNSLFYGTWFWLDQGHADNEFNLRNLTYHGGQFSINRWTGTRTPVKLRDCVFDWTLFPAFDSLTNDPSVTDYDYSVFVTNAARLIPYGTNDLVVTNLNWQSGWQGPFYLASNSPLVDSGSLTNAGDVGLYHHTTQISQVKEGNSRLDRGYHYLAAGRVAFVGTDTSTQGNWKGVYGAEGYTVILDATNNPADVSLSLSGVTPYNWDGNPSATRALQRSGTGRIAACWYNSTTFSVTINLSGTNAHRLAIYGLDWETTSRGETIDILYPGTSTVLDSRSLTNFNGGKYLIWDILGSVTVRATRTAGANAVISGLFFNTTSFNLGFSDLDGDGQIDAVEDKNGNGLIESGERDPSTAGDLGLSVLITKPANNSVLP